MGVTAAVLGAVVAAGTATASAVQSNQATQHAKGAAQAQQTAMNAQVDQANKTDAANKKALEVQGTATQSAALAALKASMSAGSTNGGSILTGPTGAPAAPTVTKTLLGV